MVAFVFVGVGGLHFKNDLIGAIYHCAKKNRDVPQITFLASLREVFFNPRKLSPVGCGQLGVWEGEGVIGDD